MIAISMKVGERILLNRHILIEILTHHEGRVRFGITAPKDIPIDRTEIHLKKLKENTALNSD